jgi:hypothetical protein
MEVAMSANDIFIRIIVVLNLPRLTNDLITYARAVNVALLGNSHFPSPTPPLDVFAAHIGELEEAQTNAATKAKGTASLRDAKVLVVKEDLSQIRSYVQSVAVTQASLADAATVVESASMSIRKPTTLQIPEISAKSAGIPGKVLLAAKSQGASVVYSWEHSLDQATWTPIPNTMKARTEVSGLTSHSTYYFRYRTLTRAGQQEYSQVVSLLVH